jgi:dihydrofolate synthase/folylpolyglutamate synthase
MGLNQDKNLEDIYFALKAQAKKIIITKAKSHRAMDIQEIHDRIRHCDQNMQIISTNNIDEAIIAASNEITSEDIICVCGSFYLAAEMREILLKGA